MPKNTVQHYSKKFTRVKNAALSFQFFIPRDTTNNVITKQKLFQVEGKRRHKVLRTQETTKAWKSWRHFLVDFEIQNGRHSVSNFVVNNFTAQVFDKKLDRLLDELKSAVKLNLAFGFILKKIEDGKFKYFYAHENNTLLEQSKLLSIKDDAAKSKEILKKTDVTESCTREWSNTKWNFFKLTNLTIFAALPMG